MNRNGSAPRQGKTNAVTKRANEMHAGYLKSGGGPKWLRYCELADPDKTAVTHIVGWLRHCLGWIAPGTLRALCGAALTAEDDSNDPGPDSPPVCIRCALAAWKPNRLLNAYRALWDWHCGVIYFVLYAVIIASLAGLVTGALLGSSWTALTVPVLIAALLAITFEPGDGESEGDQ